MLSVPITIKKKQKQKHDLQILTSVLPPRASYPRMCVGLLIHKGLVLGTAVNVEKMQEIAQRTGKSDTQIRQEGSLLPVSKSLSLVVGEDCSQQPRESITLGGSITSILGRVIKPYLKEDCLHLWRKTQP